MTGSHNVTPVTVDNPQAVENPAASADQLLTARNTLLRAKRRLDQARAARDAETPPEGERRPAKPASHFVGIDIAADLERLAEEIERSVAELLD